jgi:mono/diheme cytochrome c family protein
MSARRSANVVGCALALALIWGQTGVRPGSDQGQTGVRPQVRSSVLGRESVVFAAAQQPQRTVADGVYTQAQAERGKKGYTVFCESCHAADLSGNNSGDSGAPPLKREGFMAGSDANGLYTKIAKTMPFDAPGSLQPDEYLDIVAYIFQENGFKPGPSPLTTDADQLRAIRIIRVTAP